MLSVLSVSNTDNRLTNLVFDIKSIAFLLFNIRKQATMLREERSVQNTEVSTLQQWT